MRSSLACVIALLSAGLAPGATIVSVTGAANTPYPLGGAGFNSVLVSSWTQTGAYDNVSISAQLGDGDVDGFGIGAWLTNQIGPGTTIANVIASGAIVPATGDETDTIFTGLSLDAGSYYLVLAVPGGLSANWWGANSATETADAGVTGNVDGFSAFPSRVPDESFPPASSFDYNTRDSAFNLLMAVNGDLVVATPEPSSFVLVGLAGAFLAARKHFGKNTGGETAGAP